MLSAHLFEPAGTGGSNVKVKGLGVENLLQVDLGPVGGDDLGRWVQSSHGSLDSVENLLGDEVRLVEQDDVGKLAVEEHQRNEISTETHI